MSSATQYLGRRQRCSWNLSCKELCQNHPLVCAAVAQKYYLQCCARADHYGLYIAFYIMKFFRRNIDFRRDDDGTSDPSVIEGEFCTCFLKNDQDHL